MITLKFRLLLGICCIVTALILRYTEYIGLYFYLFLFAGVALKSSYIISSVRSGKIKMGIPVYMLYTGVLLIFTYMIFKDNTAYHTTTKVLLISAISLKASGVLLIIRNKYLAKKGKT